MSTQTLIHADIFFFISSLGFIVLTLISAVILVYVISILRSVRRITDKIERGIDTVSEDTKEFVADLQDSTAYRLLFGVRKRKKSSSEHNK